MNQLQSSTVSWTLTGLAGAVSTAAVTVLLGSVLSTPAYSAPTRYTPADPGSVTVTTVDQPAPAMRNCFMGRHSWPAAEGPPPQCRVG
jgi:hypothetical protein